MKYWKIIVPVLVILAAIIWLQLFSDTSGTQPTPVPTLSVSGFDFTVVADGLEKPRVIAFDAKERLLVSELGANRVSLLEKDASGQLVRRTLLDGLRSPHGLAFYTDDKEKITYLYVAEAHQVARYRYNSVAGTVDVASAEEIAVYSADGRHTTRTIGFGPNFRTNPIISNYPLVKTQGPQKLYISVGSSCDVCVEDSWKRGAILESDPAGSFTAEFAGGLRNAVFFAFHPVTGEMWVTEMGRDNLGDNLPPDEINIVRVATAQHQFGARRYGWPFCYGNQVADAAFQPAPYTRIDIPSDCRQTEPAWIELPAHSAPLGLAFVTASDWPAEWKNDLLVAYHGSWNRSTKTGYKIVHFSLDAQGRVTDSEDFMSWLKEGKVSGRPVDLKFHAGSLFISDDYSGVIYKVSRVSQ